MLKAWFHLALIIIVLINWYITRSCANQCKYTWNMNHRALNAVDYINSAKNGLIYVLPTYG